MNSRIGRSRVNRRSRRRRQRWARREAEKRRPVQPASCGSRITLLSVGEPLTKPPRRRGQSPFSVASCCAVDYAKWGQSPGGFVRGSEENKCGAGRPASRFGKRDARATSWDCTAPCSGRVAEFVKIPSAPSDSRIRILANPATVADVRYDVICRVTSSLAWRLASSLALNRRRPSGGPGRRTSRTARRRGRSSRPSFSRTDLSAPSSARPASFRSILW